MVENEGIILTIYKVIIISIKPYKISVFVFMSFTCLFMILKK